MRTHWVLAALLVAGTAPGCGHDSTPSDQVAQNTEDTGRFEVVRERANQQGHIEMRVRAENLDSADRIARKLVTLKSSGSQRIARIEFIGMKDEEDAPARRAIDNPQDR